MTLKQLRVWYDYQHFMSHARSARDYIAVMKNICHMVDRPDDADVVILHHEPGHYRRFVQDVPALRHKYLIGYAVWETDTLPHVIIDGCRFIDEIWTPSTYSSNVFQQHHPRVTWMPHVVPALSALPADARQQLSAIFDLDAFPINFLHITQEGITRKNTALLQRAFDTFARRALDARLIIKTIRYPVADGAPVEVRKTGNSVYIRGKLSDATVAALLDYCDVYVSPHASEGWGRPLADAMMARKPVVATGYSGNMDFMTPHNAYLVHYTLGKIRPEQVYYAFTEAMRWAFPHRESLETQLWLVYQQLRNGVAQQKADRAYQDIQAYNQSSLESHLTQRLMQIQTGLANGSLSLLRP